MSFYTTQKMKKFLMGNFIFCAVSDPLLQAYGCCVYIKIMNINLDRTVTTSLVTSKSRVSAMRNQTIPKLEFMATL